MRSTALTGGPERLRRVRAALDRADLDALIVGLPSNVLLVSGYWPVIGTSCAIVTAEPRVDLLVPTDETGGAARSWAHHVEPLPSVPASDDAHIAMLGQTLRKALPRAPQRVGVEMGPASEPCSYVGMYLYGSALAAAVRSAWPAAELRGADAILAELRGEKTRADVRRIGRACRVVARGFDHAAADIKRGRSEMEVASRMRSRVATATPSSAHRADSFVFCMSGPHSARAWGAFAQSSTRTIARGDLVLVHCNSHVDGYWTDVTRTFIVGRSTARTRAMQDAVFDAIFDARNAVLRMMRPGVRAADVDATARQVLTARGFGSAFKHSTGHGVGHGAIDAHARPRIAPNSPDVLAPGMVCNVEPAIYLDGVGGVRHCDMVAVTATGIKLLTPFLATRDALQL